MRGVVAGSRILRPVRRTLVAAVVVVSLCACPVGANAASAQAVSVGSQPGPAVQWAQRLADIRQAYIDILGREPDPGGLAFWANTSYSIAEIRAQLLASAECHQALGGECQQHYRHPSSPPACDPRIPTANCQPAASPPQFPDPSSDASRKIDDLTSQVISIVRKVLSALSGFAH